MPPKKAATKAPEKTPTKALPTKGSAKNTPKKDASKETPKSAGTTPKKPKEVVKYENLAQDKNATLPVDVTFAGGTVQAKLIKARYQHSLKLEASAAFTLLNTYTITEGENEGLQVIVLKPARAFKFMKLPVEVRKRVYQLYFYPKGVAGDPITLDGKRKTESKDPFAKSYSEGSKNRVALLAVNKEINEGALPIFYANPLRFDTPATLMTFFAGLDSHLRIHLRHIEIRQYVKKDAKNALAFLAEAKNLEHLRIELNVANEDDAGKAAKSFWLDACKLLESVGARLEKKMVPARKPKVSIQAEEEDEEDEESDEEGSGDEEDEDDEDRKSNDAASSDKPASPGSDSRSDANDVAMEDGETSNDKKDTTNVETHVNPKKPSPFVTSTAPQTPKLIQGEKAFAVDILHFGRSALKNKNGSVWDKAKKQVFLDVLEAKLKISNLSFWTCICGANVYGHSCTEELRNSGGAGSHVGSGSVNKLAREQFEHLGHGGAGLVIEAFSFAGAVVEGGSSV